MEEVSQIGSINLEESSLLKIGWGKVERQLGVLLDVFGIQRGFFDTLANNGVYGSVP
jgi:hypothetical protein